MIYRILHNIGNIDDENYNTREEVLACKDVLTFDGVYKNVYDNRDVLANKNVILFVTGGYIGKNNSFDKGKLMESFCNLDEIDELMSMGCEFGWHTYNHQDLTTLSDEEIMVEITPLYNTKYFAYPYGKFDDRVVKLVKQAGYKQAFSVDSGDDSDYQIRRFYL